MRKLESSIDLTFILPLVGLKRIYGGIKMTNTQNQGTNGLAIASFVTSLVGLTILGIIFGHISKSQIKQTGQGGSGLATAGLVIGYIFFAIQFFWLLVFVGLAGA